VRYRPDICDDCGRETWCDYYPRPLCRGCFAARFFERVLYAPIGFRLLDWQREVIRAIFGEHDETGRRKYTSAYISVAKKNGKSFLAGGLPLYHLLFDVRLESSPLEAYGCAASKDQANNVFKAAARLYQANRAYFEPHLKLIQSTHRIVRRDGYGVYRVVSADGDLQDGVEPSLVIIDELHRWRTRKAKVLHEVMTRGTISRQQPLVMQITTAGEIGESPLWQSEHEVARAISEGVIESPRTYVMIASADPKRLRDEPDYWRSREARLAANPSHEDHGGFLRDEKLVEELERAIADPSKRSDYIRYHLNIPSSQADDCAIDMEQWVQCDGGVDLREWPVYDVDLLIRKWSLMDRPCYPGVDLAQTVDLTALTLVFPPFEGCEEWTLLAFVYMPEASVKKREAHDKVPYSRWIEQGFIEATEGNAVDSRAVLERIKWAREMFDVREVCLDPWNARDLARDLIDDGFTVLDVPQSYARLSSPTKKLLELYLQRKLRHGNNPVLNWCASCLALKSDGNDNVRPVKPDRSSSTKRIDAIAAAITAMSRAVEADGGGSVYDERGVIFV